MDGAGHLTSCAPAYVVDARPARATLYVTGGDPFTFRLVLRGEDGELADVSGWEWAGSVTTGRLTLPFEFGPDDTGVWIGLRGDVTAQLPAGRAFPFDIACRQPTAGEGVTVLAGELTASPRVTPPLRDDPEARPGREDDLVPA